MLFAQFRKGLCCWGVDTCAAFQKELFDRLAQGTPEASDEGCCDSCVETNVIILAAAGDAEPTRYFVCRLMLIIG